MEFGKIPKGVGSTIAVPSACEEPFDASVVLRLRDKGGRSLDTQELNLCLEIVTHVDAAMIVASR